MEPETHREMVENYNSGKHEKLMAQMFMAAHSEESLYKTLARQIRNETRELTHKDYQKELDTISAIDGTHRMVFSYNKPTFEEWKDRRKLYIDQKLRESYKPFEFDKTKRYWFNTLDIKLYVRDPKKYVEYSKIMDFVDLAKASVPGYDFDNQHTLIAHNSTCIEGDIFSHPKTYHINDIGKVSRKNVKTMAQWDAEMKEEGKESNKAQKQNKKEDEDDEADQQGYFDDDEKYEEDEEDNTEKLDKEEDHTDQQGFFDDESYGDADEEEDKSSDKEDDSEQQGFFEDGDQYEDDNDDGSDDDKNEDYNENDYRDQDEVDEEDQSLH